MAQILLIEPDRILADQYATFLQENGHEVKVCSEAQAAILAADELTPDIIVMEPLLASHSGVEFLHEFRSYSEWRRVPIIVLSRIDAAELGLSDHMRSQMHIMATLYKPDTSFLRLERTIKSVQSSLPA